MRVLAACSLGGAGHLQPLLPFLDAARVRGHETLVVAPPALAGLVDASGHPFSAGGEPPEADVAPIRERLAVAPAREAALLANRELFGRLATTAMLPAMARVLARWAPDVVVRDPCEYASAMLAPPMGVATAQVAIGLAEVEWASIEIAAPALDSYRSGLAGELRRSPYVTSFPASIDRSSFPDTRRFRAPRRDIAGPLPDWWNGSRAPLVYVSFGTVMGHMTIATDMFRTAMHAVAGIEARVLLTVGRRFDPSQLDRIPDNVHVEPWVDQAAVLPQAEVVVCHGGSGTSFGAMAAGVPLVLVPLFADQFANAAKVAAAGAGIVVDSGHDHDHDHDHDHGGGRRLLGRDDAPRIAQAIDTVRANPSYRERARRIAAEMGSAPSAGTLLDELTAV